MLAIVFARKEGGEGRVSVNLKDLFRETNDHFNMIPTIRVRHRVPVIRYT